MNLVVLGLSITSSWGNGHATTWRALLRDFAARGHTVTFLERDVPWYASNRDLTRVPWAEIHLYQNLSELRERHRATVRQADAVIVGSYVPDGIEVGQWVLQTAGGTTAFYDIDTPVTLEAMEQGVCEYLSPELIKAYEIYFSFTGGPVLQVLESRWHSPCARPLYCAVDQEAYFPEEVPQLWDLGYLGTYSADRQPSVEELLIRPAQLCPKAKMVVAGPQYPAGIAWPSNVERIEHLGPPQHRAFYNAQRFTLNVTREAMRATGWSPSVRLFEAGACGVPVISDMWPGIENFFIPEEEIHLVKSTAEIAEILQDMDPVKARSMGRAARRAVLRGHTSASRAEELERDLIGAQCSAPHLLSSGNAIS